MQQKELTDGINALLPKARINAEVSVLVKEDRKDFNAILHRESMDADIVFLGLGIPEEGKELDAAGKIDEMSSGLKTMVYVKNSSMSHSMPMLLKL